MTSEKEVDERKKKGTEKVLSPECADDNAWAGVTRQVRECQHCTALRKRQDGPSAEAKLFYDTFH